MKDLSEDIDKEVKKFVTKYVKEADNKYKFYDNYLDNDSSDVKKAFKKKIGLYDPFGKNINPLTNKEYENFHKDIKFSVKSGDMVGIEIGRSYNRFAMMWTHLKVYAFMDSIIESIRNNNVTLITAGTGVGKTVLIPNMALQAYNFRKKIICTVPKRMLASDGAKTASQSLDVELGKQVGYFFKGDNKLSEDTLLTFTTPGSLKSKLIKDPYLSDVECVIIDEIHERSIETDQLLYLMRKILEQRPEFKIILMSATIDPTIFKDYFTENNHTFKHIDIEGTLRKVEIIYEPIPVPQNSLEKVTIDKIIHILNTSDKGDILVFVKSGADGASLCRSLDQKKSLLNQVGGNKKLIIIEDEHENEDEEPTKSSKINPYCVKLEAKSSSEEADLATDPNKYKELGDYTRKVVMSTNVAESSKTIEGVVYVIDSGYALVSSYYPEENARALVDERISQASANQRKGRAGRTQDGFCYRLYTEDEFAEFPVNPVPDIQKTDITSHVLDILTLVYIENIGDVRKMLKELLSPPEEKFISNALSKLYILGAIDNISDDGKITELGKALSKFRSIEPNLAKAILASYYYNCSINVIRIIVLMQSIDNRIENIYERYRPSGKNLTDVQKKKEKLDNKNKLKQFISPYGDYLTLNNIYHAFLKDTKNKIDVSEKEIIIQEGGDELESDELENTNTLPKENVNKKKEWCRKYGVNPTLFTRKNLENNISRIHTVLLSIIRNTAVPFFGEIKGGDESKSKNGTNVTDVADIDDINEPVKSYRHDIVQSTIEPFEYREDNILMSFAIGNIINLAMRRNGSVFRTCFPIKRVNAKIDQNCTLELKSMPQYVIYNELFTKNGYKLNMVSKLSPKVIEKLNEIADICSTREDDNKETHAENKFENKFRNKNKFGNKKKFGNRKKFRNNKKFGNNKDNVDIF